MTAVASASHAASSGFQPLSSSAKNSFIFFIAYLSPHIAILFLPFVSPNASEY